MSVRILNPDGSISNDFKASPSEVQGSGTVSVLVKENANQTLLDFELTKQINLMVLL